MKKIGKNILTLLAIIIVLICVNTYQIFNFIIIRCKLGYIVYKDVKIKYRFKLVVILLNYLFINDIKISSKTKCIIKKENINYIVKLNNNYYITINSNSYSIIDVKYKK